MSENLFCNLCENGSTFETSNEKNKVRSNVRKFQQETFTVWRCKHCNSLHSKEEVDLDHYYAHYPFQNHSLDLPTKLGYANRRKILENHGIDQEHEVLDFGCGEGLYVEYLRKNGYPKIVGHDPFVAKYADTATLDKQYDAVVSYDVIEHVADPRQYLKQMNGLLKSNGLLVVGTPNANGINLSDPEQNLMELHQPYHRHILSEDALENLASEYSLVKQDVINRFYLDTMCPGVNTRFISNYIRRTGNMIDAAVEPPKPGVILTSPSLLFFAMFGYFLPTRANMTMVFRKTA